MFRFSLDPHNRSPSCYLLLQFLTIETYNLLNNFLSIEHHCSRSYLFFCSCGGPSSTPWLILSQDLHTTRSQGIDRVQSLFVCQCHGLVAVLLLILYWWEYSLTTYNHLFRYLKNWRIIQSSLIQFVSKMKRFSSLRSKSLYPHNFAIIPTQSYFNLTIEIKKGQTSIYLGL